MIKEEHGERWRQLALTLLASERAQAPDLHPVYFVGLHEALLTREVVIARVVEILDGYVAAWSRVQGIWIDRPEALPELASFKSASSSILIHETFSGFNRGVLKQRYRDALRQGADIDGLLLLALAVLNLILCSQPHDWEMVASRTVTERWLAVADIAQVRA